MQRTTGYNDIDTAKLCFEENLRLFGNSTTEPEKFNLYTGLYKLAAAVERLQADAEQIKALLSDIQRKTP